MICYINPNHNRGDSAVECGGHVPPQCINLDPAACGGEQASCLPCHGFPRIEPSCTWMQHSRFYDPARNSGLVLWCLHFTYLLSTCRFPLPLFRSKNTHFTIASKQRRAETSRSLQSDIGGNAVEEQL